MKNKKIILIILIIIFSNILIVNSNSKYQLTNNDKNTINKITLKIEKIINQNGIKYKQKLINFLRNYQNKTQNGSKTYEILNNLIQKTHIVNLENIYLKHYSKYNIDYKKIKKYWIFLHNNERRKINLKDYSYDYRLNNSSYERSNIQNWKGIMEHKRNPLDLFYDYNKIEKWFNNRGINCKIINKTTSSESIGKYGYYCYNGECSDELIESIKVIFDIYMAEKGTNKNNNAHYRAIIHPDLTKIGVGISIRKTDEENYYEYYITTHYCTEFKNN